MVHLRPPGRRDDEGAVAIITVLLFSMVFIGLCALVVDLGLARDTRRQAQNAADASALAAGNVLYLNGTLNIPNATAAAKGYVNRNYGVSLSAGDWAACTDAQKLTYSPSTACISFNSSTAPTAVRVKVPVRQVRTFFAKIWGVNSVPVSAAAKINLVAGGKAACGLCIVGSGSHNLQNGSISISGADVSINGSLEAGPNGSITVIAVTGGGRIALQGTLANVHNNADFSPAPVINQPPVLDPLANLAMPDYSSLIVKTNSCTGGPGKYVTLTAPCAYMQPGLYVLTGQTHLSGSENIVATSGVTLFFTCGTPALPRACNSGESGGDLLMTGQGSLKITAPTTGPTQGLAVVADRNNTATFSFRGNGTGSNSGTIYAKSGTLDVRGNGAENNSDSLVVMGNMSFSGSNAEFQTSYTEVANVVIPAGDQNLSE